MADFFNTPPSAPTLQPYVQPSINSALTQYLGQSSQLPALQQFATAQNQGANQAFQSALFGTSPTLQQNFSQFGQNTQSLLNGQIPADVQAQIQNSSAFQALQGGFGGSNMAHSLTARDLGTTSLQLQQQGAQNLGQQTQIASALNPSNVMPSSMFYSPSTILSSDQQSALINNQIADQNQQIQYQNSLQRSPFDQLMTNNLATLLGVATNPLDAYAAMQGGGQQQVSNNGMLSSVPSSGGGGGGGAGIGALASACCFIFLEGQNGHLPDFARKARDTRGTNATVRGYRWMSRWLVPAMRISNRVKDFVNEQMVKPMLRCGEDYYTSNRSLAGKIAKIDVAFWFTVWTILGLTVGVQERGRDATS
jgi:hypothetical protein